MPQLAPPGYQPTEEMIFLELSSSSSGSRVQFVAHHTRHAVSFQRWQCEEGRYRGAKLLAGHCTGLLSLPQSPLSLSLCSSARHSVHGRTGDSCHAPPAAPPRLSELHVPSFAHLLLLLSMFGIRCSFVWASCWGTVHLANSRGLALLNWYALSNEFMLCNSHCANKRKKKKAQKEGAGGVKMRKLGRKKAVRFLSNAYSCMAQVVRLMVAPSTLLCPVSFASVVSCTWLAVLIFSSHFCVLSDHNSVGGLREG